MRGSLALARAASGIAATGVLLWLATAPSGGLAGARDDSPPDCRKQEATIVGTRAADALTGTPGRDLRRPRRRRLERGHR
jgi:hypothetical protein